MSDIKRNKDAGIPGNGGKFAPDTKQTSEVPLPAVPTREEAAERARLVGILRESISQEDLDNFGGYEGFDFYSEVEKVADAINDDRVGETEGVMYSSVTVSDDGNSGSYTVKTRPLGYDVDVSREREMKYATDDYEATGEDAAVAIAAALDNDLDNVIANARALPAKSW